MTRLSLTLLLSFAVAAAMAGEAASVQLSASVNSAFWQAVYSLDTPTDTLTFGRPSGPHRRARLVLPDGFVVDTRDGLDRLRREDGETFREVTVLEPLSIESPPVGYLPFTRFGDGGLLLYTGRFHACAGDCPRDSQGRDGPFQITIDPGDDSAVLWQREHLHEPLTIHDVGDGVKVYVGAAPALEGEHFLAVIDESMPEVVVDALASALPRLLAYFAQRLPIDAPELTLFASYHVPGDLPGISIKGGTLPGQIFIHFEGAKMAARAREDDFGAFLSWFFAHEAAHVYQQYRLRPSAPEESWIHEGGADAMAYLAARELGLASDTYLGQRLVRAKRACASTLGGGSLRTSLGRGAPFQAMYDCGMLVHLAAHDAWWRRREGSLYELG